MWGESSKCETNCQCSGIITDSFKINSGNNSSKRRREEAISNNFKIKMNPHTLDFSKSPLSSPVQSKRRILGEIQNSPSYRPLDTPLKLSPLVNTLSGFKSPMTSYKSPMPKANLKTPLTNSMSPMTGTKSPLTSLKSPMTNLKSPMTSLKSPMANLFDRLTPSRSYRKGVSGRKIIKVFEERMKFKMENKENESVLSSETFVKLDLDEETRDSSFFQSKKTTSWSRTMLNFTNVLQTQTESQELCVPYEDKENFDPEKLVAMDDDDLHTLHDLEAEFNNENFDQCNKYEIISTDSPNIVSRGRSTTSKITARNFEFGAPLTDSETSTSFNRPNSSRILNFEDNFEFPSPAAKRTLSVKKSLKFNESPPRNSLRHERSDSSIGSMASPTKLKIYPSESTTSMESGFVSELEEPFLSLEETTNSPKIDNFSELLSGEIKSEILPEKEFAMRRPVFHRSISYNPECKAKMSLFSIKESPNRDRKSQKRSENVDYDFNLNKRRKSNCASPGAKTMQKKPVLQRALSENNASIMSALARSSNEPELTGDFSQPCVLPLVAGRHRDLRTISGDTLAALLRGDYVHSVRHFRIIDCRYPYEFEGGHINGAENLYTRCQIQDLVKAHTDIEPEPCDGDKRTILVFHCEFSIERGPNLSRLLRVEDRQKNSTNYPNLHYPEIYLLHEGYQAFFRSHPELCVPKGYTTMTDPRYKDLLRRHRSIDEPTTTQQRKQRMHR